MASPSYVQAGSHVRGITSAESGINVSSFREQFQNPKEYIMDRYGGVTGFASNFNPSSTVTIEGEVTTSTDAIMSASFNTAMTLANGTDGYTTTSGDYFLEDLEYNATRDSFQSVTLNVIRFNGVTVA